MTFPSNRTCSYSSSSGRKDSCSSRSRWKSSIIMIVIIEIVLVVAVVGVVIADIKIMVVV